MQVVMTDEERDEIVKLVLARMEETTGNMLTTLKIKVKADQIEDLEDVIDERVAEIAEEKAEQVLKNASFTVDVSV